MPADPNSMVRCPPPADSTERSSEQTAPDSCMRVLGRAVSKLPGRTGVRAIGTEHTALPLLGPQRGPTSRARPKMDAGVERHALGGLMAAMRAGNRGDLNHRLARRFGIGLTVPLQLRAINFVVPNSTFH